MRPYLRGKLRAVKVRKRGVSPRIVAKGSRRVTGTNLRQALGANDNWMTFKKVTTNATRDEPAQGGDRGARVRRRPRLVGSVDPARRGARLIVERRTRSGKWRRALVSRVGAGGRYRVAVERRGTYRVKAAGVAGPAVRVR